MYLHIPAHTNNEWNTAVESAFILIGKGFFRRWVTRNRIAKQLNKADRNFRELQYYAIEINWYKDPVDKITIVEDTPVRNRDSDVDFPCTEVDRFIIEDDQSLFFCACLQDTEVQVTTDRLNYKTLRDLAKVFQAKPVELPVLATSETDLVRIAASILLKSK